MKKSKKNYVINFITAMLLLVIIAVGIMSVNCYIEQYEKIYRAKQLNAELVKTQNDGEKLRIDYEKRTNYHDVEDYAVNVLGLVKYSTYQVEYITNSSTNKTVMVSESKSDEGIFSRIAGVFSVIAEYFN